MRDEQGGRYGPVDLPTLLAWARDGRVGPSNTVSSDGVAWQPAAAVAALELQWLVEVSPGHFYGPVHYDAIHGLMSEGAVPPGARQYCSDSLVAQEREAAAVLAQALAAAQGEATQLREQWLDGTEKLQESAKQLRERARQLEAAREQVLVREKVIAELHGTVDAANEQVVTLQAKLEERISEAALLQTQVEQALEIAEEWRAKHAALVVESDATRAALLAQLAELAALEAEIVEPEVLEPEVGAPPSRGGTEPAKPTTPATENARGVGDDSIFQQPFGTMGGQMSLADLERQAQRELERLGARAPSLFAKKRR